MVTRLKTFMPDYRAMPLPVMLLFPMTLWSALYPANPLVWAFEALPALGLMIAALWSLKNWPMTRLSYALLAFGVALMLIGAHYTYAGMPVFNDLRESFAMSRNHFDRFGHFFQGFVPAIVLREIVLRHSAMGSGRLISAVVVFMCLGISAGWELIEWLAVVVLGGRPDVYLNFQGDPFDSYADMSCALLGALTSLLIFSRRHDVQLALLEEGEAR